MNNGVIKNYEIEAMEGDLKRHILNANAERINKSLGDIAGLTGPGVHIIEVPPGFESTEYRVRRYEDECTHIQADEGEVIIGDEVVSVEAGDFIGYPADGEAHIVRNSGESTLKCIVAG